ncbi:MAG: hypothetical protein KAW12_24115 [Candidatus Aminicenantes bacterium]|nr:hypothetical protein [Candidatus Aminicenantes bacterium]
MNVLKIFNEYEIKARYFPAMLISIPFLLSFGMLKGTAWVPLIESTKIFPIAEYAGFSVILVFFLVQVQRFIAKFFLEKRIFDKEELFPTTQMLLWQDNRLSKEMKVKIRKKIFDDFDISLYSEKKESKNLKEARRLIKDIIPLIRQKIEKGRLVHQHNIQYGFARNLLAGTLIAIPVSLFNIYLSLKSNATFGLIISIIIVVFCFVFFLARKPILKNLAENYAEFLLREYCYIGGKK